MALPAAPREDGGLRPWSWRETYAACLAAGTDLGWLLTLGAGVPTAVLSVVVPYAEFIDRARLGIGKGMDGLGVALLAMPALFTLVWASYFMSRAWPAAVLVVSAARTGGRLRPGAAFASIRGPRFWPVWVATSASMLGVVVAEVSFPGALYATPFVAHLIEACATPLVTAPAAVWGCSRAFQDLAAHPARQRGGRPRWAAAAGVSVLLTVGASTSWATISWYPVVDALPAHPMAMLLTVLLETGVAVSVGALIVAAYAVADDAIPGVAQAQELTTDPERVAQQSGAVRTARVAAVTVCLFLSLYLWTRGQPFVAPLVLFLLCPLILSRIRSPSRRRRRMADDGDSLNAG